MSIFDKIAAAVMPPESAEDRAEARERAHELAADHVWLAEVLDHHEMIEQAFSQARTAPDPETAREAARMLGEVLASHSLAEEVVLYPALVMEHHKGHAAMAYQEQQMAKVEMAELELLEPLSEEWRDKLEHIEGAVRHHMYEEESIWYPKLAKEASPQVLAHLDERFVEEWQRCAPIDA